MERVHRAATAPPSTRSTAHRGNQLSTFRADPDKLPARANIHEGAATKEELANDKGWQAFRAAQPESIVNSSGRGLVALPTATPERDSNGNSDRTLAGSASAEVRAGNGRKQEGTRPSPFAPQKVLPPGVVAHPEHVPFSPAELSTRRWTAGWAKETVRSKSLPGMLLLLTMSTANLDVISFQRYGVFTTAQTGNTILLAYHAVERTPGPELLFAGVSLAGYFCSCVVFGQIGWRLGHRTRYWMITSLCWQIILLIIITIIVSPSGPSYTQPGHAGGWLTILLAAIQGGPQLTMSSSAGVPEIPTAILTGTYASFAREEDLFHLPRYKDLKLWYITTFWTGCFIGSVVARYSHTWVGFLVALLCKVAALAWVLWAKGDPNLKTGKMPAA